MSLGRLQSFPERNKLRHRCICEKPPQDVSFSGDIINTVTCTNTKDSSCEKERNLKSVQKDVCYERQNRRKRSAKHSFTYIPQLVIKPKSKRLKVFLFYFLL